MANDNTVLSVVPVLEQESIFELILKKLNQ